MERNKTKKRAHTKLTKAEKYLDPVQFNALLDELTSRAKEKNIELFKNKDATWTISPEMRQQLLLVNESLLLRFMHRCSLLAMHRSDAKPETMKKKRVKLTEDDVDLAWKTLSMDEQHI